MTAINKSWAAGLGARVLRVFLNDNQAQFVQQLTVGDFYKISHLRLQVSGDKVQCTLGGSERLIHPINLRSSSLEEWKINLVKCAIFVLLFVHPEANIPSADAKTS